MFLKERLPITVRCVRATAEDMIFTKHVFIYFPDELHFQFYFTVSLRRPTLVGVVSSDVSRSSCTTCFTPFCDAVSVRVRIRCCLFSITLEFGVCCITWLVKQIIEVISRPSEAGFDIGESRVVVCMEGH